LAPSKPLSEPLKCFNPSRVEIEVGNERSFYGEFLDKQKGRGMSGSRVQRDWWVLRGINVGS